MSKCSVFTMILALFFAFCPQGHAQSPLPKQKRTEHRLECQFTMIRSLKVLKDTVSSSGKLYLGGPGLLRFETRSPTRSILVINQGQAWMHYPDLKVTKNFDLGQDPAMSVLSRHLLAITAGDLKGFEGAYTVVARTKQSMELVPKQDSVRSIFKSIRVVLGPADIVSLVELRSASGDLTTLQFDKVKLRKSFPAKLFGNPGQ